jgi:hypothetical protein
MVQFDARGQDLGKKRGCEDRHGHTSAVAVQIEGGMENEEKKVGEKRSYDGIGNSRDRSRRRILRFLLASLICA